MLFTTSVAHDTVQLSVTVTVTLESSLAPLADSDDEPIDPPFEVPLPLLLIVPEFIARYVCMVSVRSEIPRILTLYISRPIVSEFDEVALRRTTRVFVADVRWGQELVKIIRHLTFKVSRTTVEVSVQDGREASCWSGFALVARNSLSVETQRFLKFLR